MTLGEAAAHGVVSAGVAARRWDRIPAPRGARGGTTGLGQGHFLESTAAIRAEARSSLLKKQ